MNMEVPLCCWKKVNKSTERTVRQRGNIRETSSWDCVQNWNQIISNHSACSTTDLKDPKRVQSFFELQVCSPASGTSYLASPPKESKVGMRDPGSTPFVKPGGSGSRSPRKEAPRSFNGWWVLSGQKGPCWDAMHRGHEVCSGSKSCFWMLEFEIPTWLITWFASYTNCSKRFGTKNHDAFDSLERKVN